MNSEKKTGLFSALFSGVFLLFTGISFFIGCAGSGPVTKAGKDSVIAKPVSDTALAPAQYETVIGSLAQRVDSLRQGFMMMPGRRPIPEALQEKWSSLTGEAEGLRNAVHVNEKLEYLLGELSRIGIFFNAPDAAQMAEYYLTECVGFGGAEGKDYRPYLSLAWLNLHDGCQLPEKTHDLLIEAEKRIPNKGYPYLGMLWGYYYYSCKRDFEKAIGLFQSYLIFDPLDDRALKTYQTIKKGLSPR